MNGMELSLFQGDLPGYRYHMENVTLVDELRRKDLAEQFLIHQLLYACEWEDWEQLDKIEQQVAKRELTDSARVLWDMYSQYARCRRNAPLPQRPQWEQETEYTLFIDALHAARAGDTAEACRLFQLSIAKNGYRLQSGWSFREMIDLLLASGSPETGYWLARFEEYLKKYGYDLFWPDYFRACAAWARQNGDVQRAMLFLRRAINGYQLIEKERWRSELARELKHITQPEYLRSDSPLCAEPVVQALIAERKHLLHQSLDLQIIIQLSEQVTESLELTSTFHRLTHALFEYFPVTHLAISYDLAHRREKIFYSASGLIDNDERLLYQWRRRQEQRYTYTLYQQGHQSITLEVYVQDLAETKRRHMEHFLSFIKPHIANALHYMEMMIDNLTGFYQRRYFLERLSHEFAVSNRYGLDLSLIMLDIDNFRLINEHGHQEGDRVLRELSEIVRALLRKNDIPGRYGGEELLLILPKTDGHIALKLARDLREQIAEEFAVGRPYQVTVSVGVSSLALCQAQSIDQLIRFADDAEIVAKTTGKNKVVAAWSLPR